MHVYIMYMYTNVYMIYSCRLAGWLAGWGITCKLHAHVVVLQVLGTEQRVKRLLLCEKVCCFARYDSCWHELWSKPLENCVA